MPRVPDGIQDVQRLLSAAGADRSVPPVVLTSPRRGKPTDTVAAELEPVYVKHLPRTAPWGRPYLIWSDPAVGYALVSYGSDGQPEYPYPGWTFQEWSTLYAPETTQAGRDLVFFTGGFVQWPAGVEVRP